MCLKHKLCLYFTVLSVSRGQTFTMIRDDRFGVHLIMKAFGPLTLDVLCWQQRLVSGVGEWLCFLNGIVLTVVACNTGLAKIPCLVTPWEIGMFCDYLSFIICSCNLQIENRGRAPFIFSTKALRLFSLNISYFSKLGILLLLL